jgi:hypothetical protein
MVQLNTLVCLFAVLAMFVACCVARSTYADQRDVNDLDERRFTVREFTDMLMNALDRLNHSFAV